MEKIINTLCFDFDKVFISYTNWCKYKLPIWLWCISIPLPPLFIPSFSILRQSLSLRRTSRLSINLFSGFLLTFSVFFVLFWLFLFMLFSLLFFSFSLFFHHYINYVYFEFFLFLLLDDVLMQYFEYELMLLIMNKYEFHYHYCHFQN